MNSRRHVRTVAAVAVAAACLGAPAAASAGSLRGWWPMNEGSGQKAYDWSGNGNHGQLGSTSGADDQDPTWIRGIFNLGSALRFDGNDFVAVADSPSLRPERLTVSAWVRNDGSPGPDKYLVAKGADNCEAGSFGLYNTDAHGVALYIYDGRTWARSPVSSDVVWDGRWHHVAGTYDGAMLRTFVDGQQVGGGTPASLTIDYDLPSTSGSFGAYQGSCSLYFAGDIDGVSIWDRALPISDISRIFSSLIGWR